MSFQFGQDQELDQLRTSHNISKLFTAPSKRGVVSTSDWKVNIDKPKLSPRKEVVGSFSHISTPKFSHSLLLQNQIKFKRKRE